MSCDAVGELVVLGMSEVIRRLAITRFSFHPYLMLWEMSILLINLCQNCRSIWLSGVLKNHYCDGKHLDQKDRRRSAQSHRFEVGQNKR
jgi:hypothetical protein